MHFPLTRDSLCSNPSRPNASTDRFRWTTAPLLEACSCRKATSIDDTELGSVGRAERLEATGHSEEMCRISMGLCKAKKVVLVVSVEDLTNRADTSLARHGLFSTFSVAIAWQGQKSVPKEAPMGLGDPSLSVSFNPTPLPRACNLDKSATRAAAEARDSPGPGIAP